MTDQISLQPQMLEKFQPQSAFVRSALEGTDNNRVYALDAESTRNIVALLRATLPQDQAAEAQNRARELSAKLR